MKPLRPFLILAAVALLPVLPLAGGYGGQDFPFHIASWFDMRSAWRLGQSLPTWASHANFNLGDPHLGFYPPVSMLLGALLSSILPTTLAPAAFLWIAILLAGLAMHHASGRFLANRDRLTAAILYMLSPYLIATALVRFAAGELLVQAMLPLILLYAYDSLWDKTTPLLAALLGLAWLTNLPASIVLLYTLLILAAVVTLYRRTPAPLARILLAEALALALAAFRLAPTWAERRFIQQDSLIGADPRAYLLFMPQAPLPVSALMYVFWTLCVGTATLIAVTLFKRSRTLIEDKPALTWTSLAAFALFCQLPLSWALWTWLPQLRNVQHPFRFQPFEGVALPLLLLAPAARRTLRKPTYITIGILTLLPLLLFTAIQTSAANSPNRHIATLIRNVETRGYKGAPEYIPATAQLPVNAPQLAISNSGCTAKPLASSRRLLIESPATCQIHLPLFFYPYWHASDESGKPIPLAFDAQGLLLLTTPAGHHTLTLTFNPASRVRTLSLILSNAALLLLIFLLWRTRIPSVR